MATKKNTTVKTKGGAEYEYYRISKTIGHKYVNGKKTPIRKTFYGTSKKNAEKKYEEWKEEQKNINSKIVDNTKTFGEILEYYCENVLMVNSKYEITTREEYYKSYKRHLKNADITKMLLSELSVEHAQKFCNDLEVSHSSFCTLLSFLNGFFAWSSRNGYCNNLAKDIFVPDKKKIIRKEHIVTWSDAEINTILNSEPGYRYLPLLKFALYTGMRISELTGLKWSDISDDVIHVQRQYCNHHWKNPKRNEKRDIPLHENLKEYVRNADKHCELVFTTKQRNPLSYPNIRGSVSLFYKRNGIEYKSFHTYRATFCTNLCKKKVPIQVVSKLMGHASIETTVKYYAAIGIDEKTNAISML